MQSLDDGLTRPTFSTSFTLCGILILKSFNLVYEVWSVNTFFHFITLNVAKLLNQMLFLTLTQYGHGDQYFLATASIGDCQPKLKGNSPVHEMKTIPHHTSNWYLKRSLWGNLVVTLITEMNLGLQSDQLTDPEMSLLKIYILLLSLSAQ